MSIQVKIMGFMGVELRAYVKGVEGAVQFVLYTQWMLPHVQKELEGHFSLLKPLPADLGYHSPKPMYEEQSICERNCHLLKGPCYYDGSGLNAFRIFDVLVGEGHEGMWRELEEYYTEIFLTKEVK